MSNEKVIPTEYPKTLYVKEEDAYPYYGLKILVGKRTLESAVPDNDKENEVAVYQLIGISKYKKTVTKTSVIEEIK